MDAYATQGVAGYQAGQRSITPGQRSITPSGIPKIYKLLLGFKCIKI